jgi:anaerobic ribonucleoside-triphosphate reductase activating protein
MCFQFFIGNQAMLYYSYPQVVTQEVPGEIAYAISISGCPLACRGCHSAFTWKKDYGDPITPEILESNLKPYKDLATTVLFYGGEWERKSLVELIDVAKDMGFKVCLYTGLDIVFFNKDFLNKIDFIKTGRFIKELGGLDNPKTNQRFYILKKGEIIKDITKDFQRQ